MLKKHHISLLKYDDIFNTFKIIHIKSFINGIKCNIFLFSQSYLWPNWWLNSMWWCSMGSQVSKKKYHDNKSDWFHSLNCQALCPFCVWVSWSSKMDTEWHLSHSSPKMFQVFFQQNKAIFLIKRNWKFDRQELNSYFTLLNRAWPWRMSDLVVINNRTLTLSYVGLPSNYTNLTNSIRIWVESSIQMVWKLSVTRRCGIIISINIIIIIIIILLL